MKRKTLKIEPGDCFAYQIKADPEYKGRYIILCARHLEYRVYCQLDEDYKKDILSYTYFTAKITPNDVIPHTEKDINKLEDIVEGVTFMEDRYLPLDFFQPLAPQIEEKNKIPVYPDEMGYLYTYIFKMNITRWAQMNSLIYLGNFNVKIPKYEFIPFSLFNIQYKAFEYLEESIMLGYKAFNLKQAEIYHYTKEERKERGAKKTLFWSKVAKDVQDDAKSD